MSYRLQAACPLSSFLVGATAAGKDVHNPYRLTVILGRDVQLGYITVGIHPKVPEVCNNSSIKQQTIIKPSASRRTTHAQSAPTVAMDYSYFSAPPQPYHHFMGMSPNGFPHSGVDHDTIRSVVRIDSRGAALRLAPRTSALQGVTNLTP
jgi:hypothetical protein